MPLSLQALDFSIICDKDELETYDVKQEGPNSMTAFVASEPGKVSVPLILLASRRKSNCLYQQFRIAIKNKLLDFGIGVDLYIDGEQVNEVLLEAEELREIRGIPKSATTELPFKFQELELVGAFPGHSLDMFVLICY